MAEVKHGWASAGSVLLAAAMGFPALAQDRPILNSPQRSAPARSSRIRSQNDAPTPAPPAPLPPPRKKPLRAPTRKPQAITTERPSNGPIEMPHAATNEAPSAATKKPLRARTTEKLLIRPEEIPPQHVAEGATAGPSESPHAEGGVVGARRPGPVARWWHRRKEHCRDAFWGYPEEFEDAPLGVSVGAHATLHIVRGKQVRSVLYHYDFLPSSGQLKPRGMAHLAQMASCAPGSAPLIFVEPTPCRPDLDEARRLTVWEALQQCPFPVSPDRIVIGYPGEGLRGAEALILDRNRLQQTASRGTALGGGGGGMLMGAPGAGLGMGAGAAPGVGGGMSTGSMGSTGTGY